MFDLTVLVKFWRALGEEGVEERLSQTINRRLTER